MKKNMQTLQILYYFLYYSHLHFKTPEQRRRYQVKKMKKHLDYLNGHSPYYKKQLQTHQGRWRKIPCITKKEWMEHFNDMNTAHLDRDTCLNFAIAQEQSRAFDSFIQGVTVGLSSGTSGNRGLFVANNQERAQWAGYILAKMVPNLLMEKEQVKIAFFLRANSNLYETVHGNKIQFQYYDLMNDENKNYESLNRFSPTILIAPASVLRKIAHCKKEGQFVNVQPTKIVSVAEVLEKIDAQYIEDAFSIPFVHQVYQCTEGLLGYTCAHGRIHLAEENIIIQKKFISKDKFHPIISDFTRRTQPILRYELNDILTLAKGVCPCGLKTTVIRKIEGRSDDLFQVAHIHNPDNLIDIYPDFISRAILFSSRHISAYVVVQKKDNSLCVYVTFEGTSFEKIQQKIFLSLSTMISKLHGIVPPISVIEGLPPKDPIKKMKRIIKE